MNKENEEIFNRNKKIKVKDQTRLKVENGLAKAGYNVQIEWDFSVEVKENRRLLITCLEDGNQTYRSLNDLTKGKYECASCVRKKWEILAETKNYELLSRLDNKTIQLRCKTCNTISERPVTNLLGVNNVSCLSCQTLNYKNRAESCDLEYISSVTRRPQVDITVKCKICSNIFVTTNTVLLRLQNNNCENCRSNNMLNSLKLKNWKYIETKRNMKHKIQCNSCGDCKLVSTGVIMRKNNISCLTCRINKYKHYCSVKGCNFIRLDKRGDRTVVVFKTSDGDEMSTSISSLCNGRFATSEDNHWNLPYQLYLITTKYCDTLYYKIGIAQYASNRAAELNILGTYCVEVLGKFENRWLAFNAEQHLHNVFKDKAIPRTDVYNLSSRIITRANKAEVLDGSTEWFNGLDVLEIKKEFKDKYGMDRHTKS